VVIRSGKDAPAEEEVRLQNRVGTEMVAEAVYWVEPCGGNFRCSMQEDM
jgi:hypothetical protein